jgi:hypothetical protein
MLYIVFCQEGRTIVENKTADIIQETRKLNIRRKGAVSNTQGEADHKLTQKYLPQNPLDHETQLKASRDVRWQICVTRYVATVLHFACLNPLYGKNAKFILLGWDKEHDNFHLIDNRDFGSHSAIFSGMTELMSPSFTHTGCKCHGCKSKVAIA